MSGAEDKDRGRGTRMGGSRLLVAIAALLAAMAIGACGDELEGDDNGDEDVPTAAAGPVEGELTMSTGPLYIDKAQGKVDGSGSTIGRFEEETGVDMNYLEDINSNESFFSKVQPDLANGESGGRDIIVASDWMAKKYYDLGYAQKLDKDALPNVEENLVPQLRDPEFDPGREFTVPYQSGQTGLVVRTDLAPDLTSVNDIFDPQYKGKIDILAELRDTVPLVLKAEGIDPDEATKEEWLAAIDKLQDAIGSGQIRDVTGNDYIADLPRGDAVAAIGWSGDAVQLQADNPDIEFIVPDEGCMLWSDDMIIPVGAENPGAAYAFMDHLYDPEIAAQVSGYVNYMTPVEGVKEVFEEQGETDLADNELIFPTEEFVENCSDQPILEGQDEKEIEAAWEELVSG